MSLIDEGMLERSWPFQKGEARGVERGKLEGKLEGLAPVRHQFERRLGRPLTLTEADTLQQRLDTVGAVRLGDVVLDLSRDELAAWLASTDAR